MSVRVLVLCVLAALFAACAPRAGDSCTNANSCGSSLTCYSCNVPDGSTGVCNHPCTTNADCTGTTGPFGATPVCGMDTCGNHLCSPQI